LRYLPAIIGFLGYCPVDPNDSFGQRLALARHCLGVSQEGIASQLGVDAGTVGRWESGERMPSEEHRQRIRIWFQ
jgi:transcriptional regulator with XRE-family HTH domain